MLGRSDCFAVECALVCLGDASQWGSLHQFLFWLPQPRTLYECGESAQRPLVFSLFGGLSWLFALVGVSACRDRPSAILATIHLATTTSLGSFRLVCGCLVYGRLGVFYDRGYQVLQLCFACHACGCNFGG